MHSLQASQTTDAPAEDHLPAEPLPGSPAMLPAAIQPAAPAQPAPAEPAAASCYPQPVLLLLTSKPTRVQPAPPPPPPSPRQLANRGCSTCYRHTGGHLIKTLLADSHSTIPILQGLMPQKHLQSRRPSSFCRRLLGINGTRRQW